MRQLLFFVVLPAIFFSCSNLKLITENKLTPSSKLVSSIEIPFDEDGKLLNPSFLDYKMPKIKEIPEDFKAEFVYTEDFGEEFGQRKSLGEISINGAAPAIANAIYDAIGLNMRELPMTREKILRGLGKIK